MIIPANVQFSLITVISPRNPQLQQQLKDNETLPINLAALQDFIHLNTHTNIAGNTQFTNQQKPTLPKFTIAKHNISQYIVNDNKMHLILSKIAKTVKQNKQYLKVRLMLNYGSTEGSLWDTIVAISTHLPLAFCTALSLAIFIIYRKHASLAATVLLMKSQQAVANPVYTGLYLILPNTQYTSPATNIHPCLEDSTMQEILNISTSILIFLDIILILSCRKHVRNHKTTLIIEITDGKMYETIPIQELPLCQKYWEFSASTYISNIKIGRLFSKVNWEDLIIYNELNNQELRPSTSIPVMLWKALQLTKITQEITVPLFS